MEWTETGGEWQTPEDGRGCYAIIYQRPGGDYHWQASQGHTDIAGGYAGSLEAAQDLAALAIEGWQD